MLLENLVTRRVIEENASKSSLTRRVAKQGHLLLRDIRTSHQKRAIRQNRLASSALATVRSVPISVDVS